MLHLFSKKTGSPEECQQKRDWAGLAKAYYQLGKNAMEAGKLNQAQLWLNRADTIYSADDAVYSKVGEKLIDDCSDRIGQLEEEQLFYNEIPARVSELAEPLDDTLVRAWGLLSLARLVKLGERLAELPGCEVFGKLGWIVDAVFGSLQERPVDDVLNGMKDLCGMFYELGDSPEFWGMGSEISVSGGAPFQVFDLNGLMGVHLEIDAYLDGNVKMIYALSQGEEPPAPETGIIVGALLPDYYVRTGADRLEDVPRIQAELERIWNDYEFIRSHMTWEKVRERVEAYKKLDILA